MAVFTTLGLCRPQSGKYPWSGGKTQIPEYPLRTPPHNVPYPSLGAATLPTTQKPLKLKTQREYLMLPEPDEAHLNLRSDYYVAPGKVAKCCAWQS